METASRRRPTQGPVVAEPTPPPKLPKLPTLVWGKECAERPVTPTGASVSSLSSGASQSALLGSFVLTATTICRVPLVRHRQALQHRTRWGGEMKGSRCTRSPGGAPSSRVQRRRCRAAGEQEMDRRVKSRTINTSVISVRYGPNHLFLVDYSQ